MPADCGVKEPEVAEPVTLPAAVRETPPRAVPPEEHPAELVSGPQTKKLTVPVGEPPVALPETTAVSVMEASRLMLPAAGVVCVEDGALVSVKHSFAPPSKLEL